MVNDTRLSTPYGEKVELTDGQRRALIETLDITGETTFTNAKKKIGVGRTHRFNWEDGTEKKFHGNITASKLAGIFGKDRWAGFSEEDKNQIVEDVLSYEKDEALKKRGIEKWEIDDEEAAEKFGRLILEPGYCNLSRQALAKLLPLMEKGASSMIAATEIYGDQVSDEIVEMLPSVDSTQLDLRNPAVHRTLTELRKVVNNIIRKYGKPELIRIELARDLKNSKKKRGEITKKNARNRGKREEAAANILKQTGIAEPKRRDVEKWLLAVECEWECPYTGKSISVQGLFGDNPEFDIEHIVPFSRSLNNSFLNKTLCCNEENRNVKKNYTPYETYGGDEEKWSQILGRVSKFKGDLRYAKLNLFNLKEAKFDDFSSQQLNDTRYASKLAKQYLGLLYGNEARSRIQATRGNATAFLRREWCLNEILNDGGEKKREDHRHHAVDAVVIALTGPGTIKMLSDAARNAEQQNSRRLFDSTTQPWPDFTQTVRDAINNTVVSHRVNRKTNTALHKDSLHSRKKDENGDPCLHIRKPVGKLKITDLPKIVDPVVRLRVGEWLRQKKGECTPWPIMRSGDCARPIRNVRIRKPDTPLTVGTGHRSRNVISGSNHHLDIFEIEDKKGKPKWVGRIVNSFEAMQRKAKGLPIYSREHESGGKFKFSLTSGEIIELDENDNNRALYIVRSVNQEKSGAIRIEYVSLNDARISKDIKKSGDWRKPALSSLQKLNAKKVTITPLGEVRRAND